MTIVPIDARLKRIICLAKATAASIAVVFSSSYSFDIF
jgi:hypothetical protein